MREKLKHEYYFKEVLNYGSQTGIITELIYHKDTEEFFNKFTDEIFEIYNDLKEKYHFFKSLTEINSMFGDNQEFVSQVKKRIIC